MTIFDASAASIREAVSCGSEERVAVALSESADCVAQHGDLSENEKTLLKLHRCLCEITQMDLDLLVVCDMCVCY